MFRERIRIELILQGKNQKSLIKAVTDSGLKLTAAQLSNFLTGKTLLNLTVVEAILIELNLELKKVIE